MEMKNQGIDGKENDSNENDKVIQGEIANELNNLRFFSDIPTFNSIIYGGMNILLNKMTVLDEEIQKLKELLEKISNEKKD